MVGVSSVAGPFLPPCTFLEKEEDRQTLAGCLAIRWLGWGLSWSQGLISNHW